MIETALIVLFSVVISVLTTGVTKLFRVGDYVSTSARRAAMDVTMALPDGTNASDTGKSSMRLRR